MLYKYNGLFLCICGLSIVFPKIWRECNASSFLLNQTSAIGRSGYRCSKIEGGIFNPLSANPTKWSNILK